MSRVLQSVSPSVSQSDKINKSDGVGKSTFARRLLCNPHRLVELIIFVRSGFVIS